MEVHLNPLDPQIEVIKFRRGEAYSLQNAMLHMGFTRTRIGLYDILQPCSLGTFSKGNGKCTECPPGKCYNVYDLKWHPGDNKHNSYCRQYYSESFVMFTGPLMSAVSPGETKFHFELYYHIRYANYREGDGKGNQHKVEEKR
ncbi:hypothetical protein pdam_00012170 [Pocillopora damicornis]|uniref:Uncharacterized protein n=1 Tax=Pocillopora damicornis TaxID=46731 RepID=A0A3M6UE43_POCDA|nr:hypothetical protein pdam_00012170 [Pocillopora damicornis]